MAGRTRYDRHVKPSDVEAFVGRDWARVRALDEAHWAERWRSEGPAATLTASESLFEHMRSVRPEWPTPRDREEDLAHHLELCAKLDRAAHVFRPR
jgi:hypothetical protein